MGMKGIYLYLLLAIFSLLGILMITPGKRLCLKILKSSNMKALGAELQTTIYHGRGFQSDEGHRDTHWNTHWNTTRQEVKKIIAMTKGYWFLQKLSDFSKCSYSNCQLETFKNASQANAADVLLFQFNYINTAKLHAIKWTRRSEQYWALFSWESPVGFSGFKWQGNTNNRFNVTVTYRSDSEIYMPFGRVVSRPEGAPPIDWSVLDKKTKGAFAYVSHCNTVSYDRLKIIKALGRYIQIDIFGKCTGLQPCNMKFDYDCENRLHSKYRFYLSFENSLCKDYITEKFWSRLKSPGMFVPVALGGKSMDEYERVAPPNSYIHLYNFTSIQELGMYLRQLMANKELYERYHIWRHRFDIEDGHDLCKLCQLANQKPHIQPMQYVKPWWNNPKGCREYHPSDIN